LANDPVGLFFARTRETINNEQKRIAAVNPLQTVLDALEVDLDTSDAAPPTITVTNPDGGEVWPVGTTQTIQWTSTGSMANVKIELSRDGGASFVTLLASTPNDGSQSWSVTGPTTTTALIRVSDAATPATADVSNGTFTISDAPPPSLTVVTPNGGELWTIGQAQEIRWTWSGLSGNVKIELSRNAGRTWETLLANTANDGSQFWLVTGPASPSCFVRVSSVNTPSVQDRSDAVFTIHQ
jgi:hypothetical protein